MPAKLVRHSQLRVGMSGWSYEPWRAVFYPKKLPQKQELQYASRQVNSIEINGTFYSLQKPSSFETWRDSTPDDFVFSLKGGKFLTHQRRLRDCEIPLANFFASGVLALNQFARHSHIGDPQNPPLVALFFPRAGMELAIAEMPIPFDNRPHRENSLAGEGTPLGTSDFGLRLGCAFVLHSG